MLRRKFFGRAVAALAALCLHLGSGSVKASPEWAKAIISSAGLRPSSADGVFLSEMYLGGLLTDKQLKLEAAQSASLYFHQHDLRLVDWLISCYQKEFRASGNAELLPKLRRAEKTRQNILVWHEQQVG